MILCDHLFTLFQLCWNLKKTFQSTQRLTKDGHSDAADSDLSTTLVGDGTLVGAAVLRGGFREAKGVDDPVGKTLFHLDCMHSLWEERNTTG